MKLLFWKKEPVASDAAYAPYEEIDAKRTSKLGYFFLILMVIFGIWQGNNLLSSIQESIDRPIPNTSCTDTLAKYAKVNPYDNYSSYDSYYYNYADNNAPCTFTNREITLGLNTAYNQTVPYLEQLKLVAQKVSSLVSSLEQERYRRSQNIDEYQAALIEDVAGKTDANGNVLDTSAIGTSVSTGATKIGQLEQALQASQLEQERLVEIITQNATVFRETLIEAYNRYENEVRMYELTIFLVSVILIFPVFYFSWRKYGNSKQRRSEYAIIWGGVVATFGFMSAQVLLVFIYEILPYRILEALFAFLSGFAILWTLLYWLAFILVPAFFGFLIYLIQKKFYNKQAVTMRALKNGHCPHCSLKVLPTMNNCPICGYHLKTKCENCSHMSTSGGSFCEVCGIRRSETTTQ